jgi:hypothetical protein
MSLKVIDAAIEILRRNNHVAMRDGQLVFIERALDTAIMQRYGRHPSYYDDVLAGMHRTTKGDTYFRHDLVTYNTAVNTFIIIIIIMHVVLTNYTSGFIYLSTCPACTGFW